MPETFLEVFVLVIVLGIVQLAFAVPWLLAVDPGLIKGRFQSGSRSATTLGVFGVFCLVLSYVLSSGNNPADLAAVGRVYGFLLHVQISADLIVFVFWLILKFWPKGGAVALASFRESVRQPMFWILFFVGVVVLAISPFLPYFTLGEDEKMLRDQGYRTIMFTGAFFCILVASMSISEEIEGRAAITVMSKPISRRNFLLGRFSGFLMTALVMNICLGLLMVWVIVFYKWWNPAVRGVPEPDPAWVVTSVQAFINGTASWLEHPAPADFFLRGVLLWVHSAGGVLAGLVITFCQSMVLLSIAVALATRVPMIVNVVLCLTVYFLGHLTPILTAVSQNQYPLILFLAQAFNYILPGLDMFDMGPAVIRYAPLPPQQFAVYTMNVSIYALVYTAIVLLFGLILFEDRDLA